MRWPKFISAILHPVVMPTIGMLLYFMYTPIRLNQQQKYTVLAIVFVATYIIPVLLLVLLKKVNYIQSYKVHTISERKIPMFFMMTLFLFLGNFFGRIPVVAELQYLFYATVLGLVIIYLLFPLKIKASLHLLSMGIAIGYFLLLQQLQTIYIIPLILVLMFFSGVLASARLHLKAHTTLEVFLGFFIGVFSPFITFLAL